MPQASRTGDRRSFREFLQQQGDRFGRGLALPEIARPAALAGPVGTEGGAAVLAFVVIFGMTFMIGRYAANRMGSVSRKSALGGFDRLLGFGFGALKGLIGATLIFLLASLVYNTFYGGHAERPGWMTESRTYPLLNATSRALVDFVEQRRESGGDAAKPA